MSTAATIVSLILEVSLCLFFLGLAIYAYAWTAGHDHARAQARRAALRERRMYEGSATIRTRK